MLNSIEPNPVDPNPTEANSIEPNQVESSSIDPNPIKSSSTEKQATFARLTISLPKYLRQQVDGLIERKVVTTVSEAIRLGLIMFISREKMQRWDDQIFTEYSASILKKDCNSGVLVSRQFQKDLNRLVKETSIKKETSELRRGVQLTFKRLVQHFFPNKQRDVSPNKQTDFSPNKQTDVFPDKSLEIKQLGLKDYFFVDFEFRKKKWKILLRRQGKELIACKIGYTTELL